MIWCFVCCVRLKFLYCSRKYQMVKNVILSTLINRLRFIFFSFYFILKSSFYLFPFLLYFLVNVAIFACYVRKLDWVYFYITTLPLLLPSPKSFPSLKYTDIWMWFFFFLKTEIIWTVKVLMQLFHMYVYIFVHVNMYIEFI